MSNELSYEINYGSISAMPATLAADPNVPLFASEDGFVASLSNNECIFQVKRSGEAHVMTFQVLQALDQSREFRTIDEHVGRLLSTIPGLHAQRENVARVIEGLIARGLLVSDSQFLDRCANGRMIDPAPLRGVFIRACDRPDRLEHLFTSLSDYERRFRANRHYIVLDDSSGREAANRHRDLVREFARATGCNLTYVGSSERERLAAKLLRAVPHAAGTVQHLLLRSASNSRFGGGRSWNIALLLSAGARLVLLDDDQRLPLRRPDGARSGLDPNPLTKPHTDFYRNIENALGAGEEIEGDPIELHLTAAGCSLGSLVKRPEYQISRSSLRGLSPSRLDHLSANARVLATQHGTYGSSRTESGIWLYQLSPKDRDVFVRDRDSYLRNIEAGSVWYGMTQAHATTSATFTPFMLDNSGFLPCTNPEGRGEDALFSHTVRMCHPDALALELPVAIGHVQEKSRKRVAQTQAALTPRFNYFVSDFLQRQLPELNAEQPEKRLSLLAAHLRDISAGSTQRRVRQLREYLAYARADLIERLQYEYDAAPSAPVYWQADVRSIIEANGRALVTKGAPRLGDWDADADEARCAELLRDETARLAASYEAWPALWSFARSQGEQLLGTV